MADVVAPIGVAPSGCFRVGSAKDAIEALRPSKKRLDRRLVIKKLRRVRQIHNITTPSGSSAASLLRSTFRNSQVDLFNKPVYVLQQRDSDKICVYSDLHNVADRARLDQFANVCTVGGLDATWFEIEYPGLTLPEYPCATTRHGHLYRGALSGFVL